MAGSPETLLADRDVAATERRNIKGHDAEPKSGFGYGRRDRIAVRGKPPRGAEPDQPSVRQKAALLLPDDNTNRKNIILLIQLRWIAVVEQIVTIAVVQIGLGVTLPLAPMSAVLGALVALNLASLAWLRNRTDVSNRGLLMMLLLDVAALTAQLYLSGGAANPFISLYLLQVTLGAVLLDARSTWAIVAVTCACFAGLTITHRPLALPQHLAGSLFTLRIAGMLVCFALDAALLVVFMTRIARNLRERDARLAALKQHAAEEDHIVRMGLLASGAAHELGTPLASLSVILGDWRRMPALATDPERLQEIDEMQSELQRCTSIVTGILLAAGAARGEAPRITTVNGFLAELVAEWRAARSVATLSLTTPSARMFPSSRTPRSSRSFSTCSTTPSRSRRTGFASARPETTRRWCWRCAT